MKSSRLRPFKESVKEKKSVTWGEKKVYKKSVQNKNQEKVFKSVQNKEK